MLHPDVPEHLKGTYLGLVTDPILQHLTSLGVTAVRAAARPSRRDRARLMEQGLTNYWGYNSIGYFAPDVRFASGPVGAGQHVAEFKSMVKAFHDAGLEVLLDVVYNHTGEGNHLGPTLSFRGFDNARYYRLQSENPAAAPGFHRLRQHRRPAPRAASGNWCSTACAIGFRTCTWTAFGSTSRRCWDGRTMASTRTPSSFTWSARIPYSRRSS